MTKIKKVLRELAHQIGKNHKKLIFIKALKKSKTRGSKKDHVHDKIHKKNILFFSKVIPLLRKGIHSINHKSSSDTETTEQSEDFTKRQITPAFTPVVAEPVGLPEIRYE